MMLKTFRLKFIFQSGRQDSPQPNCVFACTIDESFKLLRNWKTTEIVSETDFGRIAKNFEFMSQLKFLIGSVFHDFIYSYV